MKLSNLSVVLIFCLLFFANCKKNENQSNIDLKPKGIIDGILQYENEFGERLSRPFPKTQITIEKDGVIQVAESDSTNIIRFENLEWGIYNLSINSLEHGTCSKPQVEINEERPATGIKFYLKGIPNSSFESIQIDSFVNNHHVHWSCSLTPITNKPLAIRLYYGNSRDVSKDNYIHTRGGGGWIVYDSTRVNGNYFDPIDINVFPTNSDSIFIAAYIAAVGYERCIETNMGLDDFSPVAPGPPVILAIGK